MAENKTAAEIGRRIKMARGIAGIKQKDLARKVGTAPTTISQYETGKVVPGTRLMSKIASSLQVSIDWLMGEDHPQKRARRIIIDGEEYTLEPVRPRNNGLDLDRSGD